MTEYLGGRRSVTCVLFEHLFYEIAGLLGAVSQVLVDLWVFIPDRLNEFGDIVRLERDITTQHHVEDYAG